MNCHFCNVGLSRLLKQAGESFVSLGFGYVIFVVPQSEQFWFVTLALVQPEATSSICFFVLFQLLV